MSVGGWIGALVVLAFLVWVGVYIYRKITGDPRDTPAKMGKGGDLKRK